MVHNKQRDVAFVIAITMLVIVNIILFMNGIDLDCNKCTIRFSNLQVSGVRLTEPILFSELKAVDLYEEFKLNHCPIKFDRVQGYYLG